MGKIQTGGRSAFEQVIGGQLENAHWDCRRYASVWHRGGGCAKPRNAPEYGNAEGHGHGVPGAAPRYRFIAKTGDCCGTARSNSLVHISNGTAPDGDKQAALMRRRSPPSSARMLGVAEVTVRRWELHRDKPVPLTADRFLRVAYSSWTDRRESTPDFIDTLAGMDQAEVQVREKVCVRESHKSWRIDHGGSEAHS
jgi:hypothetical protein